METMCMNNMRPTLYDRVSRLLESFEWSDCTFIVGTELIRAHRLILGISSPVFKVMFYGPLAEGTEITISDIDPEVFQLMIDFIYRDRVEIDSLEVGCGLLYAAKKYILTNLTEVCLKYIEKSLSTKNVLSVLPYAEWIQEEGLINCCLNLICKHTHYILDKEIEHVSGDTLRTVLEQNCINATERELIEFAYRWACSECIKQKLPSNGENKRMLLIKSENFSLLRFFSLEKNDIDWMNALDILNEDEKDLIECVLSAKVTNSDVPALDILDSCHLTKSVSVCGLDSLNPSTIIRTKMRLDWRFCCRATIRTANPLIIETSNQNIKVKIKCKKTIFISSLSIPTRQSPEVNFQGEAPLSYIENIQLNIYGSIDNNDKITANCARKANYNSYTYIDLPKPFIFNEEEWYTVSFTWLNVTSPPYKYPLCYRPVMSTDSIFTFDDNFENMLPCGSFVQDLKFCV